MPYKYFNSNGPDSLYTFQLRTSGHIYCEECDEVWCNHTKQAIIKRWDAAAIWDKPDDSEYPREFNLQIPMFPTTNLWTEVKLYLPENTPVLRYRVVWPEKDWPTICFINPGEGRNIIRTSLLDYMLGDPTRQKECSASHHGYNAQHVWENDTKPKNKNVWPQMWSVYTTGLCLVCKNVNPTNPDLVPPNQRTGVWNPGGTV